MELRPLKRLGEMYVYYDENNKPLYGFRVGFENNIIQFLRLTDELPEFIVLPKINAKGFVPTEAGGFSLDDYGLATAEHYARGNIKICDKCFKGIKSAKVVLPYNTSIMLDWGCFDDGAEIEFVVPKNMGLKQVYRRFDTGFDYENENWPILCDNRVVCHFGGYKDSCSVSDYKDYCNPFNKYSISKDYYVDVQTNEIIETGRTID